MTDQEIIAAYLAEMPSADPSQNDHLRMAVNRPDYVDRGMNGPLGGKGGTVSQPWLGDRRHCGPSEFGLMTIIEPPTSQEADEPTLEDARALGSAEFNAMTFTPPGGTPMTLDEYGEHQKRRADEKAESQRIMMEANADEDRRRRDMKDMTPEERAAYLEREDEEQRAQENKGKQEN